jgi:hypothetical protein
MKNLKCVKIEKGNKYCFAIIFTNFSNNICKSLNLIVCPQGIIRVY